MKFHLRAVAVAASTALLLAGTGLISDNADAGSGSHSAVQQAPTAAATLTPTVVTFGHKVLIAGQLTAPSGLTTAPVAGAKAYLQHLAVGSTQWRRAVGTQLKHTDSNGQVQWKVTPAYTGHFRISFPSSQSYYPAATAPLVVRVRPLVKLPHLTTAPSLTTTHILGHVHPHLDGVVYLQRYRSGAWHRTDHAKLKAGRFSFPIAPGKLGKVKYRVVFRHDATHLAAISNALNITVVHRTLRYGEIGADVLALWKRLKQLHYDVGGKTRTYGWDLVHAVTAFEKVNDLGKDGDAGLSVWKRLAHPRQPHLKNTTTSGYAVEVNMAKDVLLISKHGKLWRILDTSTGGGYTYTDSAGQPAVATTPVGHFTFLYKQTGWQHSKLGYLYYPSYFTNTGVAVHGEDNGNSGSEVPSYPASHGCVRITNNAVLRYYYKVFTVGTPVWTYN